MKELDPNFVPDGWSSDIDDFSSPPAAKKKKLSLRKKVRTSQSSSSRFAPPMSEVLYVQAVEGVIYRCRRIFTSIHGSRFQNEVTQVLGDGARGEGSEGIALFHSSTQARNTLPPRHYFSLYL